MGSAVRSIARRCESGIGYEHVAFQMRIEKLEGKFKLNQNRKPEDRAGVIEALSASDDPVHRVVAEWMTRTS
jgi:transcriptional regulator